MVDPTEVESLCIQAELTNPEAYAKVKDQWRRGILTPWEFIYKVNMMMGEG